MHRDTAGEQLGRTQLLHLGQTGYLRGDEELSLLIISLREAEGWSSDGSGSRNQLCS